MSSKSSKSSKIAQSILVLGGTRFLGRAIVDAALAAGDNVTLFNRGRTGPKLYPDLERLVGDRDADLSALAGRTWDVVVDVAAYQPASVHRTGQALSVYADHSTRAGQREDAAVLHVADGLDEGSLYGARKAACEQIVLEAFGDRSGKDVQQ